MCKYILYHFSSIRFKISLSQPPKTQEKQGGDVSTTPLNTDIAHTPKKMRYAAQDSDSYEGDKAVLSFKFSKMNAAPFMKPLIRPGKMVEGVRAHPIKGG